MELLDAAGERAVSCRCGPTSSAIRSAPPTTPSPTSSRIWVRSAASTPHCTPTPTHAWLVLACDLPFLDRATLQHLIARRASTRGWLPRIAAASMGCPNRCVRSLSRAACRSSSSRSPRDSNARAGCCRAPTSSCSICQTRGRSITSTPARSMPLRSQRSARRQRRCGDGDGRAAPAACVISRCCASRRAAAPRNSRRGAATPRELYEELRRERGLTLAPRIPARGRQRRVRRLALAAGRRRHRGFPAAGGRAAKPPTHEPLQPA